MTKRREGIRVSSEYACSTWSGVCPVVRHAAVLRGASSQSIIPAAKGCCFSWKAKKAFGQSIQKDFWPQFWPSAHRSTVVLTSGPTLATVWIHCGWNSPSHQNPAMKNLPQEWQPHEPLSRALSVGNKCLHSRHSTLKKKKSVQNGNSLCTFLNRETHIQGEDEQSPN